MLSHRDIIGPLGGILLAILLAALDSTIVTPALPVMAVEFKGLDHLSWVVVAYLLTSTALTPIYGKLSDLYGRGRLMLVAVGLFMLASALCALAHNLPELIVARAFQGLGGGGLVVTAQSMLADFVPPRERGHFQVYTTIVWTVAAVAGPPIGGWFVDHLSWRWVFWINLPLGLIAYELCRQGASRLRFEPVRRPIDFQGAFLLMAAVTGLLLVSTWGGITYPWSSPIVIGTSLASIALLAAFVALEFRVAEPLWPPRLYANRTIVVTNAMAFIAAVLTFAGIVLFPVFFELVMGFNASNAGVLLIPFQMGMTATAFATGQVMRRTGRYRRMPPAALCFAVAGCGLLATLNASTHPALTMLYTVLVGFGIGACYPVSLVAAQNAAGPNDIGTVTATVSFSRQLGGAFGAAIFWSVILDVMSGDLRGSGTAQARAALFSGGRGALEAVPADLRAAIVTALVHGYHVAFLIAAGVAILGIALSLCLKEEPLRTTLHSAVRPAASSRMIDFEGHESVRR
jgi:EmrB/QacA subfamily drug resistance transporter